MRAAMLLVCLLFLSAGQSGSYTAMKLTIYDDGLSCPGNCDAHVVANRADNGTRFVSDPASARSSPRACTAGQSCRICFGEADASCMTAMYRGAGPGPGTIDATPAFYASHCGKPGIPAALAAQCAALDNQARRLAYDRKVNCIGGATDPRCAPILATARAAAEADAPLLAQCRSLGQSQFNARQGDPARRRAHDCLYSEQNLGGPNANGLRWKKLLPAACRPGSYVGKDGLDCCSADVRFAASVHGECSKFFL